MYVQKPYEDSFGKVEFDVEELSSLNLGDTQRNITVSDWGEEDEGIDQTSSQHDKQSIKTLTLTNDKLEDSRRQETCNHMRWEVMVQEFLSSHEEEEDVVRQITEIEETNVQKLFTLSNREELDVSLFSNLGTEEETSE